MKKALILFMIAVLSLSLVACGAGNKTDDKTLIVGATAVPHAEILEHIKPILEKEGIKLEIKVFQDYNLPNTALSKGQLDANYFQHKPYFESNTQKNGITNLVSVGNIHVEPIGIYSKKVTSLDQVAAGSKIVIPNDPSNMGRSLVLLEKAGLIKLQQGKEVSALTVKDVIENSKNFEITPLDAAMLPRMLDDKQVMLAVINTNYALEAKLDPAKSALFREGKDSPYANMLVVRKGDENKDKIQKLLKALQSDDVKKFIEDKYKGAVIPAF